MKHIVIVAAAAAAAAVLAAAPAAAQSFTYTDFSSTAGLQLNSAAAKATDDQGRSVLRVTPAATGQAGSAFSTTAITLGSQASFSTAFTFNINNNDTDPNGLGSADGLVFVIQPNSSSVGSSGAGIGYQGITNSLGIEFDTFQNNEFGDPADDHVGVNLNGNPNSVVTAVVPGGLAIARDLTAFVDYDGSTRVLEVRLGSGPRPADALITLSDLDLASVLGTNNAFVGFTSGTGSGYSNHDVVNWQFVNDVAPISDPTGAVPEPATWGLMLAGFGLVGAGMRQRRRSTAVTFA